jgi:hypothetical protein
VSRVIISVCLVLLLASVSYAWIGEPPDVLVSSWEDGTEYPMQSQSRVFSWQSWSATLLGGQTFGVTDGQYSLGVVCPIGWGFIGAIPSELNIVSGQDVSDHCRLEMDVTVKGADWQGDNGFQFGVVINSDALASGITNTWHQWDVGAWYWGGNGEDFTEHLVVDYSPLRLPTGNWCQLAFYQNSYSLDGSISQAIYYIDNVELTCIPEPATMALMGLGGLALIRRKK